MIVISDTSPILNLARIELLDLLPNLYQQVLIPPAVHHELLRTHYEGRAALERALESWLVVAWPKNEQLVAQLRKDLDAGESEAIALAFERRPALLLIDERLGRRAAETLGLSITGLIGVLIDAKKKGLIDTVKPALDELISKARFWMTQELYNHVLITAGEN